MDQPRICATVTGASAEALRAARAAAEPEADLVELRLDTMERPDPEAALNGRHRPAIVTCRPVREGGQFKGSEDDRRMLLERASALGAEFIDLEWDAGFDRLISDRDGRGVVVSRHDFERTPPDLPALLAAMRTTGAEIVKLAVTTRTLSDLVPLLETRHADTLLIGMGASGVVSRILAGRFGSPWTYAGPGVAPGQLSASRLLQEFRFRRIRSDAAVYGLVGRPIGHSLSAAMHNAGFEASGINAAYVPFEASDIADFRRCADALDVRGASITTPFKLDVLSILDEVSPLATAVGAVNTIVRRDGRWIGTNTDVEGFLEPLKRRMDLRDARATILGAGGAARAVAFALQQEGAQVAISARRPEAAVAAANAVGVRAEPLPPRAASWDLLVNATPVGGPGAAGVPVDEFPASGLVYDLIYDPDPTELMKDAARAGCRVIGGIEMLVAQAERQFELWTGARPPEGLFASAAADAIRKRES
jgi:3-dehydroquinate dehydratase / shikimate dehydrogenase